MELTVTNIAAEILTIGMYVCLATTFYLKDRRKILTIQFLGSVLLCTAFLLISAYTGVAMTIVAMIRNIIFLIDEKINGKSDKIGKKDIVILVIIYIVMIGMTIPFYDGIFSLLPLFGTALFTFAIWQKSTKVYKIMGIPFSLIWIFYNLYVMIWFGVALESVILISAIIGFILEKKRNLSKEEV